jgi:hypothetical protein
MAMLTVLFRCPNTGRHFSTGVETSPDEFELLPVLQQPLQCPFCKREHRWTKRDAILAPSERWSDVPEVEECFLKAMESAWRAAAAKKHAQRDFYQRMERKWLGLAEGYRFLSEVARRHGEGVRPQSTSPAQSGQPSGR